MVEKVKESGKKYMSDNGTITSPDTPVKYPDQGTPSGIPKPITVKPKEKK